MAAGFSEPTSLRPLLDAVQVITSDLDLGAMLRRITHVAVDLVDADFGALAVLDTTGSSVSELITVAVDHDVGAALGALPRGDGILGLVLTEDEPVRVPPTDGAPDPAGPPTAIRSFLGVPIKVRDDVFGNLYLGNKTTAPAFTDMDEVLVVALAGAAGIAVANARLAARVQVLVLSEDRERIARDLHDTVIQRLFAAGMSLQSTVATLQSDPVTAAARIEQAIDDLDITIKDVRNAIFGLVRTRGDVDTRGAILDVVREASVSLGFEPRLLLEGPVDTLVAKPIADATVRTLREALSNVARHAWATTVHVDVMVRDDLLVRVSDDGVGLPADLTSRNIGRGMGNMRARTEALGGTLTVTPGDRGGTVVEWRVPIR